MTLSLALARRPLQGRVSLPGDKSLAHRAALFAALAEGVSTIRNYPDSGVTRAMRGALEALGVPSRLADGALRVDGNGMRPFPKSGATAFCGNSGTTIRLLAGAVAATRSAAVLDGSAGLRKRPMNRIADPLRLMGADVTTADGHAPLALAPAPLHGIDYTLPVASAQVKSCIELAALGADAPVTLHEPGPSRDHTARMLRAMGATVISAGLTETVCPATSLKPLDGTLPGDISSAAFLLAAAAIVPGSRVTVADVGLNPTRTGVLDVLSAMGARISTVNERDEFGEPVGDVTLEAAPLHGVEIAGDLVVRSIDEFPALAVVAAFAAGETVVREAEELRYKETDRIAAIVAQLGALGAEVEERPDGFTVRGGTLKGGTARANGDHRLAMSMALCGLRAPVAVEGAEILNESFPEFESLVASLM